MKIMVNSLMDIKRFDGDDDPYQKRIQVPSKNRPQTGRVNYRAGHGSTHAPQGVLLNRAINTIIAANNP
jgi:hypothetical protein